ncbi:MAG: hypothetical protein RSD19_05730 [Oscillospiraceae bacterium]
MSKIYHERAQAQRCRVFGDLDGALTDNALKVMVDEAYELVYGKRRESCKRR